MLKKAIVILLALVLLIAPLVVRWLYYYEGRYKPGEVTRPDLTKIEEPLPETQPFTDVEIDENRGTVLVDLAHENRVQMAELNVLQARLAARGNRLQPVFDSDDLSLQLQHAQALVIISPGIDWTPDEIQWVQRFVDKGGRLLLVTDPSRFGVIYDEEWGYYIGLDSDVPHINDLASRFGLVFEDDYLYNTTENEGNFRNIILTDLAKDTLTDGLEQLVFFAAHSISSQEPALLTTSGETRSSTSERAEDLTVGLLAADGAVLALGDLTFMTEPSNAVRDNDQFLANIADFLSSAQRSYDLSDFPYFFGDEVQLVYAGTPLLNGDLVEDASALQARLEEVGKTLALEATEDEASDTLFLGLYEQAEEVEPYLAAAQVTLIFTPTETLDDEDSESDESSTGDSSISATEQPTTTETLEGTESLYADKNRIAAEPVGEMSLVSTNLLLLQADGNRTVMVALADSETGLQNALERLAANDLEGCVLHEIETTVTSLLAFCPSGEASDEGGWQEEEQEEAGPPDEAEPEEPEETEAPPVEPLGSIVILSLDDGTGRYDSMTSAQDYADILQGSYEVTIWSIAEDGWPGLEDLALFDLSIWTAGDFEDPMGDEASFLLYDLMFEGVPVIFSGAYINESDTELVQKDIQVSDATHPLAEGFEEGQVIEFVTPPSGSEYEIGVLEDWSELDGDIVFVRGPNSEASDMPSVVTLEDDFSDFRLVYICFPVYLLPQDAKAQFVVNAVSWLLSP